MEDKGKIEQPEPRYLPEYDYTVWEYDDHVMIARGNVRDMNDAAVMPVYLKDTGPLSVANAFRAEVEIDVDDITADEVTTAPPEVDDEPEESMY